MKFRKKPVVVEATQWFKMGDHHLVKPLFRPDPLDCERCGKAYSEHGAIHTLEDTDYGSHLVCPDDWIITGIKGEHYACKPDIFAATYEPAPESPAKEQPGEQKLGQEWIPSWHFVVAALEHERNRNHEAAGMFPQHAEEHREFDKAFLEIIEHVKWARDRSMPFPPPPERP